VLRCMSVTPAGAAYRAPKNCSAVLGPTAGGRPPLLALRAIGTRLPSSEHWDNTARLPKGWTLPLAPLSAAARLAHQCAAVLIGWCCWSPFPGSREPEAPMPLMLA